jgi:hypothetical protein
MIDAQMTAGVVPGDQFETIRYPDDEIRLRVTDGGNVKSLNIFRPTAKDRRRILINGIKSK